MSLQIMQQGSQVSNGLGRRDSPLGFHLSSSLNLGVGDPQPLSPKASRKNQPPVQPTDTDNKQPHGEAAQLASTEDLRLCLGWCQQSSQPKDTTYLLGGANETRSETPQQFQPPKGRGQDLTHTRPWGEKELKTPGLSSLPQSSSWKDSPHSPPRTVLPWPRDS